MLLHVYKTWGFLMLAICFKHQQSVAVPTPETHDLPVTCQLCHCGNVIAGYGDDAYFHAIARKVAEILKNEEIDIAKSFATVVDDAKDGCINRSCPWGWLQHGCHCYYFDQRVVRWTGAKQACKTMKADLVSIETPEENKFIQDEITDTYNMRGNCVFLGAYKDDSDNWLWLTTGDPVDLSSNKWARDEPSWEIEEVGLCIDNHGKWWGARSDEIFHFVCEKPI